MMLDPNKTQQNQTMYIKLPDYCLWNYSNQLAIFISSHFHQQPFSSVLFFSYLPVFDNGIHPLIYI